MNSPLCSSPRGIKCLIGLAARKLGAMILDLSGFLSTDGDSGSLDLLKASNDH